MYVPWWSAEISDLCCYYCKIVMAHWRIIASLAVKYFLFKACTFFIYCFWTLSRQQYNAKSPFICTRKPKTCLIFLWYSLHCNGLELNHHSSRRYLVISPWYDYVVMWDLKAQAFSLWKRRLNSKYFQTKVNRVSPKPGVNYYPIKFLLLVTLKPFGGAENWECIENRDFLRLLVPKSIAELKR